MWLDDLDGISLSLSFREANDDFSSSDISSTLSTLYDSTNKSYMGLAEKNRSLDYFLPHYYSFENKMMNLNNSQEDFTFEDALMAVPRNITDFCNQFHPDGTYQPTYCRNPAFYNYDMMNFQAKYMFSAGSMIYAYQKHRKQALSHYTYDISGSVIYAPSLADVDPYQVGGVLGADFFWLFAWYAGPTANPSRVSGYVPPYIDDVSYNFIITAQAPVYFGDFMWGMVATDITVTECLTVLNNSEVTNNTMFIIVEPTHRQVLLADIQAYKLFFNTTPSEIYDKPPLITDLIGVNFIPYWDSIQENEEIFPQEQRVNISGTEFILAFKKLSAISGWIFIQLAPVSDYYPKIYTGVVPLSDAASLGIFVSSFVLQIFPIGLMITVFLYRNKPTIRCMSILFTNLAMIGSIFLILSPIFLTKYADSCMAWLWLLTIGYVLFFGSLLVKTYRIERIFSLGDKLRKATGLSNYKILPGIILLLGIQLVLLIIWTVITPLGPVPSPLDPEVKVCGALKNEEGFWSFVSAQFVYYGLITLAACYFSYRTRRIYLKEYREAKEVLFAVYNFTVIVILSVIVVLIFQSNYTVVVIVISAGTYIGTIVSLVAWIGVKLWNIVLHKADSSESNSNTNEGADKNEITKIPDIIAQSNSDRDTN